MLKYRKRDHIVVLVGLVLIEVALFVPHLTGWAVFMGDSDRLNTFLNIRKFEIESLQAGGLRAWNEFQFMGMSTWGLPYMLPDPFTFFESLFSTSRLFFVAGIVAALLMGGAAVSAYLLISDVVADRTAGGIAAALFPMSTYGVLRIGQVDSAFLIFVFLPLGLWLLRRVDRVTDVRWSFLGLTAVLAALMVFTFLQESAYAMLLFGAFALYRCVAERSWRAPVILSAAGLTGGLLATPRLLTVVEDLRQLDRGRVSWAPNNREILRLFYDGIFGRYHEEAHTFGNGINLHEGLLLYTSTFATLLVVFGMIRFRGRWLGLFTEKDGDLQFHAWCVITVLAVILTPWGQRAIEMVFLRTGFLHARLSLAALLSLCVLLAGVLADLRAEPGLPAGRLSTIGFGTMAFFLGVGLTFADGAIAEVGRAIRFRPLEIGDRMTLVPVELTRLLIAVTIFIGVMIAIGCARWWPGLRAGLVIGLGALIVTHTFSYAWFKLYGNYAWSYPVPFKQNNFFTFAPAQFRVPSLLAAQAFRDRLENDRFRTSLVCDRRMYAVFCAPHIAQFWRLRLVDGYVPGVPARLAALPWPDGVRTLRAINFSTASDLPWPLLGLLNVKHVVKVNEAFYFNVVSRNGRWREARPEDVEIRVNPAPVAPREFFPAEAIPVATATDAARRLGGMYTTGAAVDPTRQVVVEGLEELMTTAAEGPVVARYDQDQIEVRVEPRETSRFLVINDLYHPQWKAFTGDRELRVYPTDVVMRGILVPPGVSTIELRFVPFIATDVARVVFVGGAFVAAGGFLAFGRVAQE